MSQENVEIVSRVYDAINRRDWTAAFRDAAADFQLVTQRGPNAGIRRGREPITDFAKDYIEMFDDFAWERRWIEDDSEGAS